MKASMMIEQLRELIEQHGDFDLIASKDEEGNGYNAVRGVDIVVRRKYAGSDDGVYDSMEEAQEDYAPEDLHFQYLVFV